VVSVVVEVLAGSVVLVAVVDEVVGSVVLSSPASPLRWQAAVRTSSRVLVRR